MSDLSRLVADELGMPVAQEVSDMAAAIAAKHGAASRAVLFYGSCLREKQLDGLMLDFYLIVSDYAAAFDRCWLATANRLIPPNVFPFASDKLAAKYAVLSEADFARLCDPDADTVSVWARFAQPSRLVWVADSVARGAAVGAVAKAAPTLLALARPMTNGDLLDVWRRGFELTYASELRAESSARPGAVVDADPERYAQFADAISVVPMSREEAEQRWTTLRRRGKIMSVLRLAKATATFAGGIDYLAWKINRHAGTAIAIKPWQRRFPILGGVSLLPRLLRSGAVR
ncbi:hypothetical protein D3Y57_09275 [Sphingomonas paeninsulae]|uniref:Phosphatidate cytidylyltransferase n=1 Tax=Sphingomonas paeninsulae TaxID=2319844 RepID=A0A494TFI0_SPHPE|nr:hypothetical protein [Sphingomonas paeninsulae]AYJ86124.1 hypothetical protein D3Y57_09275 [Sphingomonas paeninsulae]